MKNEKIKNKMDLNNVYIRYKYDLMAHSEGKHILNIFTFND
jgi:hypothetical protein